VTQLESTVANLRTELAAANAAFKRLKLQYIQTLEQLALLRRRMFLAKAERLDTAAEQLAFDLLTQEAKALEKAIDLAGAGELASDGSAPSLGDEDGQADPDKDEKKKDEKKKRKNNSTGRRTVADIALPIVRVEVTDPELEGHVERIGFQDSWRLGYERGGQRRVQIALAVYKVPGPASEASHVEPSEPTAVTPDERDLAAALSTDADAGADVIASAADHAEVAVTDADAGPDVIASAADHAEAVPSVHVPRDRAPKDSSSWHIVVAPRPKEILRRGLLAPTMIAYILIQKFVLGLPCFRLERYFRLQGVPLSRGIMYRYIEHVGATLGAIVEACREAAIATAFCLSTDATGVLVQPEPREDGRRQPCFKGHFFVTLADKDYVFFDYQRKHTSVAVWNLFNGFRNFIQADANAVYDALFRGKAPKPRDGVEPTPVTGPPPKEVGCWTHARRPYWEAAVCKHHVGLVGLQKIKAIYEADGALAQLAPAQRKLARQKTVLPLVDAFFAWVEQERTKVTERGLVATALGYSHNQELVLRAFFADGRLRLDNNPTESAIRPVCTGRKAWLFFGSDDHASAAANVMSLGASCMLHELDPELYFAEIIHVMPYWPRDRYLELAPLHWKRTRERLDPLELARQLGPITVPTPMPAAPAEQEAPADATADGRLVS